MGLLSKKSQASNSVPEIVQNDGRDEYFWANQESSYEINSTSSHTEPDFEIIPSSIPHWSSKPAPSYEEFQRYMAATQSSSKSVKEQSLTATDQMILEEIELLRKTSTVSVNRIREEIRRSKLKKEVISEYVLIRWPESQEVLDKPWFGECILMSDKAHIGYIGTSAYFVPKEHYLTLNLKKDGKETSEIEIKT